MIEFLSTSYAHLYNEQFVHGRLDRALDLVWLSCLQSASVSLVYLVLYVETFFDYPVHPSLYLLVC